MENSYLPTGNYYKVVNTVTFENSEGKGIDTNLHKTRQQAKDRHVGFYGIDWRKCIRAGWVIKKVRVTTIIP